ncbi:MAG TPA: NAD(P)H-dependent oxidoreductase [Candidatus Saccharimonadia bacterium]|jgi:NAD(P)H-dependent FMN reductase|nr:NAD(P)H-dependent oxidoreductase [Candidatus Saccharimonadia bacterium]
MKINVIIGTVRPGRVSERVAKWVAAKAAEQPDMEVKLVDLADFGLMHFNEPVSPRFNPDRKLSKGVAKWLESVDAADGFVIVTPEYNHSVPGVLKDALDVLKFEMAKKPVAIVSHGTVGGARAAEHLKGILIEARAAVVPQAVALIGATSQIDEDGHFAGDPESPVSPDAALGTVLKELSWWTATLKNGRAALAK